jgi:hypothetical protein
MCSSKMCLILGHYEFKTRHMTLITLSISPIICTCLYTCILRGVPTKLNLVQGDDVTVWKAKLCAFDPVNALAVTCVEQYSNVTA